MAKRRDIDIEMGVSGVDQTKRDLREGQRAVEGVGESTKKTGEASRDSAEKFAGFGGAMRGLVSQARMLIGSLAGSLGLVAWIRAFNAELERTATAATAAAAAMRDLAFLSPTFSAAEQEFVQQQAISGARKIEEVGPAYAQFKSATATLTDEQRQAAFREVIELGRTTSGPLGGLATSFAALVSATGTTDFNALQNLIQQTKIDAPTADIAAIGGKLPEVLAPALALGMTPGQAAGLFSFAGVSSGNDVVKGSTAMRNVLLSLSGKGSRDAQKALQRVGLRGGEDFFQQITALSGGYKTGKIGAEQMTAIAGREGFTVLAGLLRDPGAMSGFVERAEAAYGTSTDLTAQQIGAIHGGSDLLARDEQRRRVETIRQIQDAADLRGIDVGLAQDAYEAANRDRSVVTREFNKWAIRWLVRLGVSPETAAYGTGQNTEEIYRLLQPGGGMRPVAVHNNQNQVIYNTPPESRREITYGDTEGVR